MTPKPLSLSRDELNRLYLLRGVLNRLHDALYLLADPIAATESDDENYYDAIVEVAEAISTEHHALLNRFTKPE